MQAADMEKKDCNSFTLCVAIGMFVLGLWGIDLPSYFPGTGLDCCDYLLLTARRKRVCSEDRDRPVSWGRGNRIQVTDLLCALHQLNNSACCTVDFDV